MKPNLKYIIVIGFDLLQPTLTRPKSSRLKPNSQIAFLFTVCWELGHIGIGGHKSVNNKANFFINSLIR